MVSMLSQDVGRKPKLLITILLFRMQPFSTLSKRFCLKFSLTVWSFPIWQLFWSPSSIRLSVETVILEKLSCFTRRFSQANLYKLGLARRLCLSTQTSYKSRRSPLCMTMVVHLYLALSFRLPFAFFIMLAFGLLDVNVLVPESSCLYCYRFKNGKAITQS